MTDRKLTTAAGAPVVDNFTRPTRLVLPYPAGAGVAKALEIPLEQAAE
ncbi:MULTISPECIES: hypothetical protein [Rhizobium]|nr:hypothetical protein [Rhizobium miluonense]